MKTLRIIFLFLLTLSVNLFSQYSVPLRLVNSDGTPNTGEAANISFTAYPHTYPDNVVSGITVTEVGTAGNYVCKGFTTYQYVKLWLSGVNQTWFDSVQVGSITSYLSSNYMSKTGTQTGFTGTKTLTGDWLWTAGTVTMNKPYIYSSSTWYTDYSLPSATSLIWKGYADSVYGIKAWYYDGTKLRLISSGYKWYGRNSTTAPIDLNSSHFQWTDDKLNLLTSAIMIDSIKHDNLTVGKDTTWTVLGEDVSKWRFLSLKKTHWYNAYSIPDWKWLYKSFNETGTLVASDSFAVINRYGDFDYDANVYARSTDSIAITAIDTFYFDQPGVWQVSLPFEYEFEYVTPNNSGYDSLYVAIYQGEIPEDTKLDYLTIKKAFNSGVPFGDRGRTILQFGVSVSDITTPYILAAVTSGICHTASGSQKVYIRRNKFTAILIR